jgi:hypothetical protein
MDTKEFHKTPSKIQEIKMDSTPIDQKKASIYRGYRQLLCDGLFLEIFNDEELIDLLYQIPSHYIADIWNHDSHGDSQRVRLGDLTTDKTALKNLILIGKSGVKELTRTSRFSPQDIFEILRDTPSSNGLCQWVLLSAEDYNALRRIPLYSLFKILDLGLKEKALKFSKKLKTQETRHRHILEDYTLSICRDPDLLEAYMSVLPFEMVYLCDGNPIKWLKDRVSARKTPETTPEITKE